MAETDDEKMAIPPLIDHTFRPCRSSERQPEEKFVKAISLKDPRSFGPPRGTKLRSEKNAIERYYHS